MTVTATPSTKARRLHPHLHLRWLAVLITGGVLYGLVLISLIGTQDPVYIPVMLLLGAAVVPVAFTTFVTEIRLPHRLPASVIATAAVLGGVIGSIVAGQLETSTVRHLGHLPTLLIGLIEESAKLAVPAALLIWRRHARAADGLLLGVAVGSGFAALETMGYGFVALLQSHGNLLAVTDLLSIRAVAAPGGHAAWTGLACAALFAIRAARHPRLAWLRFGAVFAGVVVLHAIWDSTATGHGYLIVGSISFAILMLVTWQLHRSTRSADRPGGVDQVTSAAAADVT